ncbi:MAG: ribosome biogenesis factor YjgA [Syntrophobacteraceae bacterium]|nr:ribosome biogenesis factor YjgA [Syntrophobacteraceae bacterium]
MQEDMSAETEPKSKSQVKREMLSLQALGERLAELASDQIKKIELPLELRDALLFCKTIRKGEARRRQLQYIGALMREADPEPIEKALHAIGRGGLQKEQQFKEVERWRDKLIDGDNDPMDEILSRFPGTDRQTLRQLVLNARKEREGQKPPKASRVLFRFLKGLSKGV